MVLQPDGSGYSICNEVTFAVTDRVDGAGRYRECMMTQRSSGFQMLLSAPVSLGFRGPNERSADGLGEHAATGSERVTLGDSFVHHPYDHIVTSNAALFLSRITRSRNDVQLVSKFIDDRVNV